MYPRSNGQSIVEMAFVAPILFMVLFGIIDMGWYIFSYASVAHAARNGAEAAAQLPPYPTWLGYRQSGAPQPPAGNTAFNGYRSDRCVDTILSRVEQNAVFLPNIANFTTISYPNGDNTRNLGDRGPIEVTINMQIQPLTPLFSWLGINRNGPLTLRSTVRRSIENLGTNPDSPTGIACARDVNDWRTINP